MLVWSSWDAWAGVAVLSWNGFMGDDLVCGFDGVRGFRGFRGFSPIRCEMVGSGGCSWWSTSAVECTRYVLCILICFGGWLWSCSLTVGLRVVFSLRSVGLCFLCSIGGL